MADVTPDLIFRNEWFLWRNTSLWRTKWGFLSLADASATLDDVAQRTGIPRRTLGYSPMRW